MGLIPSRSFRARRRRLGTASAVAAAAPLLLTAAVACSGDHSDPASPPPIVPIVVPACTSPAPLLGTYHPQAPEYIIMTPENSDDAAIAARLTAQYGIQVIYVYEAVGGLSLKATPEQVARLRCDPDVLLIEFDGIVYAA